MQQYPNIRFFLRDATAACHALVDAAMGGYDLTDRQSYGAFLTVHARVVLPLEAQLDAAALWSEWRGRSDLLRADLIALGIGVPAGVAIADATTPAERWGLLYVLEGSRLGGAMLARRVEAGLPTAYLSAAHRDGSWARFGDAMDAAATAGGDAWRQAALTGARRGFAAFEQAV